MPFILDHDNVITAAISFHAYRLQAETRLKQYIKDNADQHKTVGVYCFMVKDNNTDDEIRADAERYCKECAAKIDGWDYAGAYIDTGYKHGRKFPDRPEFRRMLDDARNGRLDLIFVYNMERFAETIDETGACDVSGGAYGFGYPASVSAAIRSSKKTKKEVTDWLSYYGEFFSHKQHSGAELHFITISVYRLWIRLYR